MSYRRCRCPIWVIGMVKGKPLGKSLETCGWDDAETKLSKLQSGGLPLVVSLKDANLRFIADGVSRNLSPDTIYKYRLLFTGMQDCLVNNVRGITTDDLAKFRKQWDMSPISAKKQLERMKAFFRFCQERGWIASNPALPLKPPKGNPMPTLPFSEEELKKLWERANDSQTKESIRSIPVRG